MRAGPRLTRNSSSALLLRCATITSSTHPGTNCIRSPKISWRHTDMWRKSLRRRTMPGEAMPRVDVAGGSLQYRVAGQGEASLLIPGLGGLGSFWDAQIKAFSPRFRTIIFDHRGVGESTGAPPYSAELWAQDIVAL